MSEGEVLVIVDEGSREAADDVAAAMDPRRFRSATPAQWW